MSFLTRLTYALSIMTSYTQNAILWPDRYLPGKVDNWVSNEQIVVNLRVSQVWPLLADPTKWTRYYGHNAKEITPPSPGPFLTRGASFKFSTFGFPVLTAHVEESVEPKDGEPGRLAWSAEIGEGDECAAFYHAWLLEDLEGGRVRILTQESQIGKPAAQLGAAKPNVMLLGHQDWIDGLIKAARGEEVNLTDTNLGTTDKCREFGFH